MGYKEVDEQYKLTKKKNNGLVYSFYWWVGYKFAHLFKFLKVSPNVVSWMSLLLYIAAGYFFIQTNYLFNLIGGFLYYLGVQFDAVDGKLARMTNKTSKLGVWLDYNFDNIRPLFLYPTIAYSLYLHDHQIYWFLIAFVAMAVLYTSIITGMCWDNFSFASNEKKEYVEKSKIHKILKEFYFLEGIEPILIILFLVFDQIEIFLVLWTLGLIIMYIFSTVYYGSKIKTHDLNEKNKQLNHE